MYSIIGIPSLLVAISAALSCSNDGASTKRIAVVGEGVIGLSTALAIKEMDPNIEVAIDIL
uniref:Ldh_1_N domain-containing protein n=1 Tax=Heterorhabditis bacteriophora TaxID=37862 RepID=A0A1I7W6F3_HETBA